MKRAAMLAIALATAGCGTSHALPHPTHMPAPRAACSIGVASFADDQGVDFSLDLRDYLREHGPCRTVRAVTSRDDETVDLVIAGRITARLTPTGGAGQRVSTVVLGVGIGALVGGAVVYGVAGKSPTPDSNGFVSPADRNTQRTMQTMGAALLGIGAAATVAGIVGAVVDGAATRPVVLEGGIDVEVTLTRRGAPAGELREHDDVTARGRHPAGRPESRDTPAAAGPLYREVLARVFEHIASNVGDIIEGAGPRGPAPEPRREP